MASISLALLGETASPSWNQHRTVYVGMAVVVVHMFSNTNLLGVNSMTPLV